MQNNVLTTNYIENYHLKASNAMHSLILHYMHSYVIRMYRYVIRMSFVYARLLSVCHSYVLVCHPFVTPMYSYVTRMYHGDIILNRSNNSMFLRLKIY